MNVHIEDEYGQAFLEDYEETAREVVEFTLDYLACPYEAEVNIVLTSNEEIATINEQFRNIPTPTDVLSFPVVAYDPPCTFEQAEEEGAFHPDTGELLLGDMMISVDKIKEQAEEYGHSIKREFAFLIVHSMLHLAGYDHIETDEAAVMEEKQKHILESLKINR